MNLRLNTPKHSKDLHELSTRITSLTGNQLAYLGTNDSNKSENPFDKLHVFLICVMCKTDSEP